MERAERMTMPVVIPVPGVRGVDCVAGRALYCEGVTDVTRVVVGTPAAYADLLGAFWQAGDGFILVEDDMAPWPGAIDQLRACPEQWCRFDYSIGFGRFGRGTLGCMKFSPAMTRSVPDLWRRWDGRPWQHLDAAVVRAIEGAFLSLDCHVHTPPIAHARHYRGAR
jgi:hypothetical protein